MPYTIVKVGKVSDPKYAVVNSVTGTVHSKHTTWDKARGQVNLLYELEREKDKAKGFLHR